MGSVFEPPLVKRGGVTAPMAYLFATAKENRQANANMTTKVDSVVITAAGAVASVAAGQLCELQ